MTKTVGIVLLKANMYRPIAFTYKTWTLRFTR